MIEIVVLVLVVLIAIALMAILRSVKHLALNALVGLIILYLANSLLMLGIGYSWVVVLICAIGGALGAAIVIILHVSGMAF